MLVVGRLTSLFIATLSLPFAIVTPKTDAISLTCPGRLKKDEELSEEDRDWDWEVLEAGLESEDA